MENKAEITVKVTITSPVIKVWEYWTNPKHIVNWNFASEDWHTPRAENDLRVGGKFTSRMEAKDGSFGFDFGGVYTKVENHKHIEYTLEDDRKVQISFASDGNVTILTETFEAEGENSLELQQAGWQAILNQFKKYAEAGGKFKMHFNISIKAKAKHVYDTMIFDCTYREWTSIFNPTSRFEGSWNKGSKILFLGTGEDGNIGGMVSRIKENIPESFISIEHLGILKNGIEIVSGPDVEEWAGLLENYSFSEKDGATLVEVDIDTNADFKSYFSETWPKALEKLKEICEE